MCVWMSVCVWGIEWTCVWVNMFAGVNVWDECV